jgi:hypothetical protein
MNKPNSVDAASLHPIVMRLFREQSVTISKLGSKVFVHCENVDNANSVFEWLASINGKYETVDDWLNEIEAFALRRERIDNPMVVEPWVRAAFDAGCSRESA